MDDIFAGSYNLEFAKRKRDDLIKILRSAEIELDKWAANHSELLPDRSRSVGTLGLRWNPVTDVFGFSIHRLNPIASMPTKRTVLSNIARVFDPLGWLAPITGTENILMQDLWILKCEWDLPLLSDMLERWCEYSDSMKSVSTLSIGRWLGTSPDIECEIHGFSDASSRWLKLR